MTWRVRDSDAPPQVLSVIADDDNKVFGVTFRTPPRDSTGLPHILEHSVLCGSRQYPTKEPFVELLKGSLQTFLNAFTYPDRTCYPVASQNLEDFRNLARVYLDAVFHPRAATDPTVLQQEGWHYEIAGDGDKLEYSGVVYNEMKGVYSSPDALMARSAQQELFPDNAYSVDSGGDPGAIPDLDFEQFAAFHGEFYHPANARIFFYGDDDPSARLDLLEEYLADFTARDVDTAVKAQPLSIATPKKVTLPFPASASDDDEGGQHMVSVNWLLDAEAPEPVDELGLAVLDHLLLGTSTSVLRKALTDSGLGESVIGGGLQDELRQPTFAVGLKGVAKDDVEKVEALVEATIANLARDGFEADDVEASLNTVEFQLREFNTGSFPKGLSFMLGMMRNWIYERDPVDALRFEAPLAALKDALDNDANAYFRSLLELRFVKNTHRVTVEMKPDATLEASEKADEEARLAAARDEMTPAQLDAVAATAAALKEKQTTPDTAEDLATIPSLGLDDLEKKVKSIPKDVGTVPGAPGATLLSRELPTAGIVYADVALDLRGALDAEDLPLVPLFGRMLQETGVSNKYDATQFTRRVGARTGGLQGTIMNTLKRPLDGGVATGDDLVYRFILRGKATRERASDLFDLMADVLVDADFASAEQRCTEMLKEAKARYESSFRTSGQSYPRPRRRLLSFGDWPVPTDHPRRGRGRSASTTSQVRHPPDLVRSEPRGRGLRGDGRRHALPERAAAPRAREERLAGPPETARGHAVQGAGERGLVGGHQPHRRRRRVGRGQRRAPGAGGARPRRRRVVERPPAGLVGAQKGRRAGRVRRADAGELRRGRRVAVRAGRVPDGRR